MGENSNLYWYNNGNGNGWNISTITATNATYTVGTTLDRKVEELEKEIKELKKRLSNLSTLVCTHIGKEQLEKFNKENG